LVLFCICCCDRLLLLLPLSLPFFFVKNPAWFEATADALFEPAPLAASPTFGVDFAIFCDARKLFVPFALHGSSEKCFAAVASLMSILSTYFFLIIVDYDQ